MASMGHLIDSVIYELKDSDKLEAPATESTEQQDETHNYEEFCRNLDRAVRSGDRRTVLILLEDLPNNQDSRKLRSLTETVNGWIRDLDRVLHKSQEWTSLIETETQAHHNYNALRRAVLNGELENNYYRAVAILKRSPQSGMHLQSAGHYNFALFLAAGWGEAKAVDILTGMGASKKAAYCAYKFAKARGKTLAASRFRSHYWGDPDFEENYEDPYNFLDPTNLISAALFGHCDLVRIHSLLGNCNTSMVDHLGNTPLFYALENRHTEVARLLLSQVANIREFLDRLACTTYSHFMSVLVQKGNLEILQLLLNRGADIYTRRPDTNCTALMWAILRDHYEAVSLLLHYSLDLELNALADPSAPIFIAAEHNRLDILELLVDFGFKIDIFNESGQTPLFVAAKKGHIKIVKILLARGAALQIPQAGTCPSLSPVFTSAENNRLDVLELLLDTGFGTDIVDGSGLTPLSVAVKEGHAGIVKTLLHHVQQAGIFSSPSPIFTAVEYNQHDVLAVLLDAGFEADIVDDGSGLTPLSVAVKEGHAGIVKTLLHHGAAVQQSGTFSSPSPIFTAVEYNQHDVLAVLLDAGFGADIVDDVSGLTPLSFAVKEGLVEMAKTLLYHTTTIQQADSCPSTSLVFSAVEHDQPDVLAVLLDAGLKVDILNDSGQSPLSLAAKEGHVGIVRTLLRHGVAVPVQQVVDTVSSPSPVLAAAKHNRLDVLEVLLKAGFEIDIVDDSGFTPLSAAAKEGRSETVLTLLRYGATDHFDDKLETSLMKAASVYKSPARLISLLIKAGFEVNAQDLFGRTALHHAILSDNIHLISILVKAELSLIEVVDSENQTALHYAVTSKNVKAVEALVQLDARVTKSILGLSASYAYAPSSNGRILPRKKRSMPSAALTQDTSWGETNALIEERYNEQRHQRPSQIIPAVRRAFDRTATTFGLQTVDEEQPLSSIGDSELRQHGVSVKKYKNSQPRRSGAAREKERLRRGQNTGNGAPAAGSSSSGDGNGDGEDNRRRSHDSDATFVSLSTKASSYVTAQTSSLSSSLLSFRTASMFSSRPSTSG